MIFHSTTFLQLHALQSPFFLLLSLILPPCPLIQLHALQSPLVILLLLILPPFFFAPIACSAVIRLLHWSLILPPFSCHRHVFFYHAFSIYFCCVSLLPYSYSVFVLQISVIFDLLFQKHALIFLLFCSLFSSSSMLENKQLLTVLLESLTVDVSMVLVLCMHVS